MPVASAMNWEALRRRRGGRAMRSPSRSCSPTTERPKPAPVASAGATKPRSRPSTASATAPSGTPRSAAASSTVAVATRFSRSRLPIRSREPRVQAATTALRPAFAIASACSAKAANTFCPLARASAKSRPGRPPASMPSAPSGRAKGRKRSSGPRESIRSQPRRSR